MKQKFKKWAIPIITVMFISVFMSVFLSFAFIESFSSKAYESNAEEFVQARDEYSVGIVFGGGVADGSPLPLLKNRLDAGYDLISKGQTKKLILSGDNRFENYNEPLAMYNYLTEEKGVDPEMLQVDYAGRSTYETCERAKKVFGVNKAVLVTDSTHLPRALFLCQHFGIESIGLISADSNPAGLRLGKWTREILARQKAIFNAYIYGEKTILGEPINLEIGNFPN
jgi:vancomycin permeability regulator SanA